jgi:hypothetical protein
MAGGAEPADEDLTPEMEARIQAELGPGERVLWSGRPRPQSAGKPTPLRAASGCLLFAIACLVFAALNFGGLALFDWNPVAVGSIATAIGLMALAITASVIHTAGGRRKRLGQTCYALTDRRAILWAPREGTDGLEVRSFLQVDMNSIYRVEYPDGTGDLYFRSGKELVVAQPEEGEVLTANHGFEGIRRVRDVEVLLRRTLCPRTTGPDGQRAEERQ